MKNKEIINKIALIQQSDGYSSGAACLKSLLLYYETYFHKQGTGKYPIVGFEPKHLVRELENRGYWCVSGAMVVADLRHFLSVGRLCICLTNYLDIGNYVLVYRIERSIVYFMCPVLGFRKLSSPEFVKIWKEVDSEGNMTKCWAVAAK